MTLDLDQLEARVRASLRLYSDVNNDDLLALIAAARRDPQPILDELRALGFTGVAAGTRSDGSGFVAEAFTPGYAVGEGPTLYDALRATLDEAKAGT